MQVWSNFLQLTEEKQDRDARWIQSNMLEQGNLEIEERRVQRMIEIEERQLHRKKEIEERRLQ